jgi:hypothetical protein
VSGRPWTKAGPVRNLREVGESPADGVATIAWDEPADNGGLAISHYVVRTSTGRQYTVGGAPGGGRQIDFVDNGRHSVTVWAVTHNGDRAVDGDSQELGDIDTWGRPGAPPATVNTSNDHYKVSIQVNAGDENGKDVTGVEYSNDGGASWHEIRSGSSYSEDVPEGGTTRTILARTVSAADGDRKYSEAVRLSGTSKAKELAVDVQCNALGGGCYVTLRGAGFQQSGNTATVTLIGIEPVDPDKCNFTQTVGGWFSGRFGGGGCTVSKYGQVEANVAGMTDRNY